MMCIPQYIVRLDDACPTLNRERWSRVEQVLLSRKIKPIVAITPDNRDPDLMCDEVDPSFWDRVRLWQAMGWTIGMHGLSHILEETQSVQFLPFHRRSEFSGLAYEAQAMKLRKAKAIFDAERIQLDAWIAPAHAFDRTTLRALKDVTNIEVLSDGIAFRPFDAHGFRWVPQQLWSFRPMPFGLWTVCFHPNTMDEAMLDIFMRDVASYADRIVDFRDIQLSRRRRGILDRALNAAYWLRRGEIRAAFR